MTAGDFRTVLGLEIVPRSGSREAPVSRSREEVYSGPMRRLLRLLRDQAIPAIAVVAFDLGQRRHLFQVLRQTSFSMASTGISACSWASSPPSWPVPTSGPAGSSTSGRCSGPLPPSSSPCFRLSGDGIPPSSGSPPTPSRSCRSSGSSLVPADTTQLGSRTWWASTSLTHTWGLDCSCCTTEFRLTWCRPPGPFSGHKLVQGLPFRLMRRARLATCSQ
jgi:hypothetical protein